MNTELNAVLKALSEWAGTIAAHVSGLNPAVEDEIADLTEHLQLAIEAVTK